MFFDIHQCKAVLMRFAVMGVLPVITFMQSGCAPTGDVMLNINDSGSTIEITQGHELSVELESNPSTGYAWQVAEIDNSVLEQKGESEFILPNQLDQPQPGAGGAEILRFSAVGTGRTNLHLIYIRTWEQDPQPDKEFLIEVVVR